LLELFWKCRSCFNVNFNVNFKIVFKTVHLWISWWMKNFESATLYAKINVVFGVTCRCKATISKLKWEFRLGLSMFLSNLVFSFSEEKWFLNVKVLTASFCPALLKACLPACTMSWSQNSGLKIQPFF
jgi:hypothetical protein